MHCIGYSAVATLATCLDHDKSVVAKLRRRNLLMVSPIFNNRLVIIIFSIIQESALCSNMKMFDWTLLLSVDNSQNCCLWMTLRLTLRTSRFLSITCRQLDDDYVAVVLVTGCHGDIIKRNTL